jgi:CDP-diacylglycerol--serine O-phosphatidyltransferase
LVTETHPHPPLATILRSLSDAANLVTVFGLCAGVVGILAVLRGEFYLGGAFLGVALLCDMLDGNVARRLSNRSLQNARLGVQLDSLADVVHGGVLPSLLVVALNEHSAVSSLVAVALCVAVVLRLAHFNVFGLSDGGNYMGVPVIFNSLAVALAVGLVPTALVGMVLLAGSATLAALNVLGLPVPKLRGVGLWLFLVTNLIAILANLAAALELW